MTPEPVRRRGSFFETWRLYAIGWPWLLQLMLLTFAIMFVPIVRTPAGFFTNVGILGTPCFVFLTATLETQMGNRLAFMTVLPQPAPPKWLVLGPLCVLAVAPAAFSLLARPLPAVAAVTSFGCALWTIGATRWWGRLGLGTSLIALPVLALAPIAAWLAFGLGGWPASAAVSMALALVALAFQPRGVFTGDSSRLIESVESSGAGEPAGSRREVSRIATGRRPWLASAVRYHLLNTRPGAGTVILFLFIASIPLASAAFGMGLMPYLILGVLIGSGHVYSNESGEFIRPRPFGRGQLFVGGILVPLLLVLLVPVLAIPLVSLGWFNVDGVLGWLTGWTHNHQGTLNYVRNVLGATFLPAQWPAGGLTADQWLRVRPLLYWDLVRCALLAVAFHFGMAPVRGSRAGEPARTWIGSAIYLMTLAWGIRNTVFGKELPSTAHHLPVMPVWFAALLAAAAIAHWSWAARFIKAPARDETEVSLRGAA